MVDDDVTLLYDNVVAYLKASQAYLLDPAGVEAPVTDLQNMDLTSLIYTIQRQVKSRPSMGEAATIKAYRDMVSAESEIDIRLMKRADYWTDANEESLDNIDKWIYNKTLALLHMNGKDMGA